MNLYERVKNRAKHRLYDRRRNNKIYNQYTQWKEIKYTSKPSRHTAAG